VNLSEAKSILIRHRPGTADAEDPQVAEALALAETNPELARWLEAQSAQQTTLRARFRQITPPAGLKEQILSEHAADKRPLSNRSRLWLAAAALLLLLGVPAIFWPPRSLPDNSFTYYQNEMVRRALGGYAMDLKTTDVAIIEAHLAGHHAPAGLALSAPLQTAALVGCAAGDWQGAKVSLVCFRTGKPLETGAEADLWLFVVDRKAVNHAPDTSKPKFAKVNRLITASWTAGGKLYLLGTKGEEPDLKKYL
jgi:hypothetical protein